MKFKVTLANCGYPALTADVEVDANSRSEANSLALDLDFDELEWSDDLGRPFDWSNVEEVEVFIAEPNE